MRADIVLIYIVVGQGLCLGRDLQRIGVADEYAPVAKDILCLGFDWER
jgi:hypothetical protein